MTRLLVIIFVFGAGVLWPIQAAVNARLREGLTSPTLATSVNGLVGALTALIVTLAIPAFRPTRHDLLSGAASVPAWGWVGGVLGAWIVLGMILGARALGASVMIAWFLAGMLAAGVLADHMGILGYEVRRAGPVRLLGIALLLAGALLVTFSGQANSGQANSGQANSDQANSGQTKTPADPEGPRAISDSLE